MIRSSRSRAPLVAALALAVVSGLVSRDRGGPVAAASTPPNILIVIVDDMRWDETWVMDQVGRLADRGVTFTNAYAGNPSCCPSRASLLTGLYAHNTGVWTNGPPLGGFEAFNDGNTIGVEFQRAGYETGLVGKYLNGYADTTYVPPGWDYWRGSQGATDYFSFVLVNESGEAVEHSGYVTDVLTDEGLRFINRATSPWLLVLSHIAPHQQAVPAPRHEDAFDGIETHRPPSYNERDLRDKPLWLRRSHRLGDERRQQLDDLRERRLETLLAVDESLATLSDRADVVIFTSDNGFLLGEHRRAGKGLPYLEAEHVPLVISGLGGAGLRRRPVSNVDLAPTLYDVAGISYEALDGKSLLPSIVDDERLPLYELLERPAVSRRPAYCGLVGRRWHVVFYATQEVELYDLRNDPYQLSASIEGRRSLLQELRDRAVRRCRPTPPGFEWSS